MGLDRPRFPLDLPGPRVTGSRTALVVLLVFDLLRQAPEEVLLSALSLLAGGIETTPYLSALLGWAVVGYVLYRSVHVVLPSQLSDRDEHRRFHVVFTLLAVVHAVVLSNLSLAARPLVTAIVVPVVSAAVLVAAIRFQVGWTLFDTDGAAVALIDAYVPSSAERELADDLEKEGWLRTVALASWVAAVAVVVEISCFAAGFAATVLSAAFPLPDVLLLAVVLADLGLLPNPSDALDVEDRVYDAVAVAKRDLKGLILVLLGAAGGISAGALFSSGVTTLVSVASFPVAGVLARPLVAWNMAGLGVALLGIACYLLWVWLRAYERVAPFLDLRDGKPPEEPYPTRPRWTTVPPTVGLFVLAAWLGTSLDSAPPRWAATAFAVAWPAIVLGLGAVAHWTRRTPPQRPLFEDLILAGSFPVQAAGVYAVGSVDLLARESVLAVFRFPSLWFLAVVSFGAALLPDVGRYAAPRDGLARFALVGYLLALGVVTAGFSLVGSGDFSRWTGALAGLCVVGAAVLAWAKWVER